ncbi:class II glutamine amidotransferase domain-containing protein [Gimesia panareensis]|uniref:amidophosphoribosyltransferase n=1 Tax=Gimesia panareensis TaxID=2527978 RepID=UPI00118C9BA5|nr:amidophosphoribosyltransferase [Gimesia panareensis]QDU52676.1 Glutamine--fructose-6-phosphate aminotransferase [isomerizing] [Gimesia panareensis]
MCGIVGFLARSEADRARLGQLVTPMLECMATRGPDSAGLALFRSPLPAASRRFALYAGDRAFDWQALGTQYQADNNCTATVEAVENHAALLTDLEAGPFKAWLGRTCPEVHLLSAGHAIEIYKDEGHPEEIARRFHFSEMVGTHAVGHTRMATESAVSPAHAHPFTAGEDFCLVHNGSLSNPYSVRRKLESLGIAFETDNDTEAGCRFLEWRMREGDTLETAIEVAQAELDGFYTFLMATADKMVLVRDAFACKPAVVAETDDYVAVSSEFRSLAHLPDIKHAHVYEPAPEQIYSWSV